MNIDQQVCDAFQIEHREQLQRIRALLLDMESDDAVFRAQCIDEAFRMAHSLKGGARVCDLRPPEALGHGLETMFSKIREGVLDLDDQLTKVINVVLDGIEDWMAALLHTETPPEPVEALRAMETLLQEEPRPCVDPPNGIDTAMEQRLQTSFLEEYPRYIEGLKKFLEYCGPSTADEQPKVDDAFCLAHDLRATARAANLSAVETAANPLEQLFRQLRDGAINFDAEVRETAHSILCDIESNIANRRIAPGISFAPAPSVGVGAVEDTVSNDRENDREPSRSAATVDNQIDTVRVRADSLDRLLQSSSQLLTESFRQDQMARELNELKRTIEVMQRERESLRRHASASLHGMHDRPELRHLTRYFESSESDLHVLSQNARKLYVKQQRSSWLLRSHSKRIQEDIKQARMISAHSLFQAFPKMVRDLARDEGKEVEFKLLGSDIRADRMVLQALKDPVMHMLRNAVTHGIETADRRSSQGKPACGQVNLTLDSVGNRLRITIQDDGQGIDLNRIAEVAAARRNGGGLQSSDFSEEELTRLIFDPGFSTSTEVTELAGRGMGLSVAYETVKRLQGHVQLPNEGPGTAFILSVPLSVCTHRLLLVATGEQTFAVPLHAIDRLVRIKTDQINIVEGIPVIMHQNQLVPITSMTGLVGAGDGRITPTGKGIAALILKSGAQRLALTVDAFLGERDALVQDLDAPAANPEFAGAMLTEDGEAVLVLNPSQLFESDQPQSEPFGEALPTDRPERRALQVLVVDDSFTTRTLEKSILETHGYRVHVAIDGIEALSQLQAHEFDAVISDLEMPRLDGFGLLEEMKRQPKLASIPVILVTSRDRAEDQQRGLELGAEAYIVKRKFDHQDLLNTVEQVIASPV